MDLHATDDELYPAGESEHVTDPARIAGIVRRMIDHRALLTVTVPGSPQPYLSAVLEVDPLAGYLLLDELVPPDGHAALLRAGRFAAHAHLSGVDISFSGVLQQAGVETQGAYYRIALPATVRYRQRRAAYRVPISRGHRIPLIVPDGQGPELQGLLHDISAGGLGSQFDQASDAPLERGQVLHDCLLRLSDDQSLAISIEICFVSQDSRGRRLRLGGRFLDLPRAEQKIIEHFVAAMDREWRQRTRRD